MPPESKEKKLGNSNQEGSLKAGFSDILILGEANQDDSIDSGNFSVSGYLPLI